MKKTMLFAGLIATMTMVACSATKITSSWREADKTVTINQLNKVLVVALFNNETNRRKAEDQMAGYLKGKGVVSYNYFSDKFNRKNEAVIRETISADGFDGAVTMRVPPSTLAIAGAIAEAVAGLLAWAVADYRKWRALGPGGLPSTWRGWLTTTRLRLQMRDPLAL